MQDMLTNDSIVQTSCKSPYLLARKNAGMKRVDAANMLGVSERTLAYYEYSCNPIPDDVVLLMCRLYNAPWLRAYHLGCNTVFTDLFGKVPDYCSNYPMTVLSLQNNISEMSNIMPKIIENTLHNKSNTNLLPTCQATMNSLFMFLANE